jgi:hypothetical protein
MQSSNFKAKVSKILVFALMTFGFVSIPVTNSTALTVGSTNTSLVTLAPNSGLQLATQNSTSAAVLATTAATNTASTDARSFNLKYSDNATPATGLAQVATIVAGGSLSLYAAISTSAAISATGGTISATAHALSITSTKTSGSTGVAYTLPDAAITAGTAIAAIWTSSTVGTYTISISYQLTALASLPTATNPLAGYEVGSIFVNVVADSHPAAGSANVTETLGAINGSLFVGTASNTTGSAAAITVSGTPGDSGAPHSTALSRGLLYKDATYTTAQTAQMLTSGQLSLYAAVSTSAAFVVSGGTFSSTPSVAQGTFSETYSADLRTALITGPSALDYATSIGIIWTAPSTAGTYTVSLYVGDGSSAPTIAAPAVSLAGQITVTVVAAANADGPVVGYSTCTTNNSGTLTPASTDYSSAFVNGNSAYINMQMVNSYLQANSLEGNIVVTSSSADSVVAIGGTSVAAGTGSTVVAYGTAVAGDDSVVRVNQATAGKPVTTTVTITFNGAVICTKTITIRGAVDSMVISNVSSVESDGNGTANAAWLADGTLRDAHMYIQLKDSAGNTVLPGDQTSSNTGYNEFTMDAASVSNLVTAFTVANGDQATSLSSSSVPYNYSAGKYTCGANQYGTQKVTVKHTSAATGKITTGTFDARCAGDAYTYTASFDKASYNQGEIATLTVSFKDSKGNAANAVTEVGASEMIVPMMTFVTATGAASTTTKADGTKAYTLTVGTTTGMTAGTYSGIIDFTGLTAVAATKQTVTYKLSTGSSDVSFTEVLKSVVALIASINKQIQALQKLILKR